MEKLYCYGNPCTSTTLGLDQIYCQLPERQKTDNAIIYVSREALSEIEPFILATNAANANNKNWTVCNIKSSNNEITNTTGNYECKSSVDMPESNIAVYPNPANHILNIKSDTLIESLELYDISGRLVLSKAEIAAIESSIDVSSFARGIYTLKLRTANGSSEYKVSIGN